MDLGLGTLSAQADQRAMAFRFFLGRSPGERTTSHAASASDLDWFLTELTASREFAESVLRPLNTGAYLPHHALSLQPADSLLQGLSGWLPLSDDGRARLLTATAWGQALRGVLTDPAFVSTIVDMAMAISEVANPPSPPVEPVVGALRSDGGMGIEGWAADTRALDTPLHLTWHAGPDALGPVFADRPDRFAALHVGGEGRHGFAVTLPATFWRGRTGPVVITVRAEPDGVVVGKPLSLTLDLAARDAAIAAARAPYVEGGRLLGGAAAHLVDVVDHHATALSLYPRYRSRHYGFDATARADQRAKIAAWVNRPWLSIILPLRSSETPLAGRVLAALREQTYDRWDLLMLAGSPDAAPAMMDDRRCRVIDPGPIPVSETLIKLARRGARGGVCVCLAPDEVLSPEALYGVARAFEDEQVTLVTADEDRYQDTGDGTIRFLDPQFKSLPDPDLLRSAPASYGKPLAVRTERLPHLLVGLADGEEDPWSMMLGPWWADDAEQGWRHLPRILSSRAVAADPDTSSGEPASSSDHPFHGPCTTKPIVRSPDLPTRPALTGKRAGCPGPSQTPKVAILIATRDRRDLLEPCIDSIYAHRDAYPGPIEILIGDNETRDPAALRYLAELSIRPDVQVIHQPDPFNWAGINNDLAARSDADVLVFLNNDTVVLTPDWLSTLTIEASRPDVGVVGPRLIYADATIQSAGLVIGARGAAMSEAMGHPSGKGGPHDRTRLVHQCGAVTGACLVTRRTVFAHVDGFDAERFPVAFNDVDYGLRVRAAGLKGLYTPHATLYHLESQSRGLDISADKQAQFRAEHARLVARWGDQALVDPFMNPHFEPMAAPHTRLRPPPVLW